MYKIIYLSLAFYAAVHLLMIGTIFAHMHHQMRMHACMHACIIQKQTICIMALWGVIFESEGNLKQCIYHFIKQKALMHNACMMIMHKCMHLLGIYLLICT